VRRRVSRLLSPLRTLIGARIVPPPLLCVPFAHPDPALLRMCAKDMVSERPLRWEVERRDWLPLFAKKDGMLLWYVAHTTPPAIPVAVGEGDLR